MFASKLSISLSGIRTGFGYLWRGARELARDRDLWPYVAAPAIINAGLLALFVWGVASALSGLIGRGLPDVWWETVIVVAAIIAILFAVLYLGSAFFVFIGSIIAAPFYDALGERMMKRLGRRVPDRPWWKDAWPSAKYAAIKLWWYLLLQGGLIVLYVIPGFFGPTAYIVFGFLSTVFFLALEFLDIPFGYRNMEFRERRAWCLRHKGPVLGFGVAIFFLLVIPVVNLLIPPAAVIGAILLYHDYETARH